MARNWTFRLDDILEAIDRIERYAGDLRSAKQLQSSGLTYDGIILRLQVIGEATKYIPAAHRNRFPDIEWQDIVALRNFIVHEYNDIDAEIIWKVVRNKLPEYRRTIQKLKQSIG